MAIKFRKRLKLLPGVTLNISRSGVSATIGMKGLSVNLGKKGAYLNTSIPGTGIYSREKIFHGYTQSTTKSITKLQSVKSSMGRISVGKELERLSKLKENGVLTEDEFLSEKNKLLGKSEEIDTSEVIERGKDIYHYFLAHKKSKVKATWIALLLGIFGVHKFYLGKVYQGILYLLLLPTGFSILWWIFDVFHLSFMSNETFLVKYNRDVLAKAGVNIDYIERGSALWLFINGDNDVKHIKNNTAEVAVKIGVLVTVAYFAFNFFANRNHSESEKELVIQTQPDNAPDAPIDRKLTYKECNQISLDTYYFARMRHYCYVENGVDSFNKPFNHKAFLDYKSINGCPSEPSIAGIEQEQKNDNLVNAAMEKGLQEAKGAVDFCNKELNYFNKVVNKYGI